VQREPDNAHVQIENSGRLGMSRLH